MDQVITFDKSLQQRLQEYKDVLSGYEILPVSAISREWGFYLELALDPNGWQAVWKIPRATCENLNIPFPSVVLVFVLDINFKELHAIIKILAVQDDIHLPEKHFVPLMQLWPTKDQDKSVALNIISTANALDMLRFFYMNIFMPWDQEDDDTSDWLAKHLESRLRLYYDVKNGVIPRPIAEHLHSLLTEARRLQAKRELIENNLLDSEIDIDENPSNKEVQVLMEAHLRMLKIKGEVEILENPLLRDVVIRQQKESENIQKSEVKQQIWLIYEQGKVDDYIKFLELVKQLYPEENVKFYSTLALTLENANLNDVFVLNEATHCIRTVGALETGGILKGIADKNNTIVTSRIENLMLDFRGEKTILENITIDCRSAQCGILVRRGHLLISNCKIIGDGKSSTHQGIIVLAGGEIEIVDTEITGFSVAVTGNSGSKISLVNVMIHEVISGLKIFDNCVLKASKCTFRNCKGYGICVETENNLEGDTHKGDFDSLNIIPDISTESLNGENNTKGNVLINQKRKIKAMEDIFNNTVLGPSSCYDENSEQEDMDTDEDTDANTTVIVKKRALSPATI